MIYPIQVLVCENPDTVLSMNYVSKAARAHEKNRWAYNDNVREILRLKDEQCDFPPDFLYVSSQHGSTGSR